MARVKNLPWHAADWAALQPLRARNAHAVLLHGPAGIGKKSLALDLADSVLCETAQPGKYACGQCAGCLLLAAGNHPDLRIVVPEALAEWRGVPAADDEAAPADDADGGKKASREILIDQVRDLSDFLTTSTHRGGTRVVMLAPAERLNGAAANALLKMLEEPPPASLFILVSDALDEVLPTIRSRAVLLRCTMPSSAQALAWLQSQDVADAETLLAQAGGAPLAALALAQTPGLAATEREALMELLKRGGQLSAADVATRVPRLTQTEPAIDLFQRWGWDLLAHRTAGTVRYHRREASHLGRLAASVAPAALLAWLKQLAEARATRDHPLNARLVVESMLLAYAACWSSR